MQRKPSTLTYEEIEQGLRNIGYAVDCGACMSVFFTGSNTAEHNCSRKEEQLVVTRLAAVDAELESSEAALRDAQAALGSRRH